MAIELETAAGTEKLRRIAIDPLTRVEGHGKVTLLLDKAGHIHQARLHISEFRGFEKFIQGRPYWEAPVLVQRLCGICPVSHHLAAAKAVDQLVGVDQLSPTADRIRRLMHYGQTLQSHALHFFHLCSPDLLFGFDDEVRHRNILGVIEDHPDIARQGILLRKYGQEVIRLTAGKRIHGTGAIAGGVNKALNQAEVQFLQKDIGQIIRWAEAAVALIKRIYLEQPDYHRSFATIDSSMLSLVGQNGQFEIYEGRLRASSARGERLLDDVDPLDYLDHLREEIKSWSYMKFPYLRKLGPEQGWYRVGPLARVNNCEGFSTPLAEQQRQGFMEQGGGKPVQSVLAYHWARMIELLHCAEAIDLLLDDPELQGRELVRSGEMRSTGIGVIEAPRGTLFHHYEIDEQGLISRANLVVSTTHNNQAMNESVRRVAVDYLDGRELTEPLLNQVEVAIRAYDPCLSCATHAMGKMPLQISLVDARGKTKQQLVRDADGGIRRTI